MFALITHKFWWRSRKNLKTPSIGQRFPIIWDFCQSRARYSTVYIFQSGPCNFRQSFITFLVICKFLKDLVKTKGANDRIRSNMGHFDIQEQVILRSIAQSGRISPLYVYGKFCQGHATLKWSSRNSKSFEMFCLSSLPASSIMIR